MAHRTSTGPDPTIKRSSNITPPKLFHGRSMEDETSRLAEKAQELGDLELAVLLCLIAGEHCIIEADAEDVEQAEQDLRTICSRVFGLNGAVLRCDQSTSLDDFGNHIIVDDDKEVTSTLSLSAHLQDDSFSSNAARRRGTAKVTDGQDEKRIADVVIARDLHLAPRQVQIQALDVSSLNILMLSNDADNNLLVNTKQAYLYKKSCIHCAKAIPAHHFGHN
jgi:hypothetical protein